jgi:hypothetical protein
MKMERRFPMRPRMPTPLRKTDGTRNSKMKSTSEAGGSDDVRFESSVSLPSCGGRSDESVSAGVYGHSFTCCRYVVKYVRTETT